MAKSCRVLLSVILIHLFILSVHLITNLTPVYAADGLTRPKIGLALGGGSAKGFAHIGVMIWLEENRIPVDYVTGTSMGGLMGGCYAMGMSPAEIRDFVKRVDWSYIFSQTPFSVLNYRRKEDWVDYPVDAEMGFRNNKLSVPSGLPVHQVGLVLSRLTLPYSNLNSFDELPIPYRCVATDIQSEKAVVMGNGSLAGAMRATMAIPGVFTPVERDGHWLVDGGVLNNVPADIVKNMGADIVIAVDVSGTVKDQPVGGIDQVLMRTISTVINDNSHRSQDQAETSIKPDLTELKSTDWKKAEEFIEQGYQAAARQGAVLKKWALEPARWREYLTMRSERRKTVIPIPTDIEVDGTDDVNAGIIAYRLVNHIGKPLDVDRLESDLTAITGSGLYESLRYQVVMREGSPILRIDVIEKQYGPPFMDFAFILEVDSMKADRVDLNARCRISSFHVVGPGSELRADLGFGTNLKWQLELYDPLFGSAWFIAPAAFLEQDSSSLFDSGDRIANYKTTDTGFRLDLGYTFNNLAEMRLGYSVAYQDAFTQVGVPIVSDAEDGMLRYLRLKINYQNADRTTIPRKGLNWFLESRWYTAAPDATSDFGMVESSLLWMLPVAQDDLIFTKIAGGASFNGTPPLIQQFKLGGPFRLGTYQYDEFHGNNYLLANLGYLKQLGKLPLTSKGIYFGVWLESGAVCDNWSTISLDTNISFGLMSPTIFGPVYIGTSYGKGANPLFYVGIGKIF